MADLSGHLNLDGPPVTPRPSATVLLVRDGDPWELLMVHRPGGAGFARGAYVFPGGTVHADDRMWEDEIRAAAIRELFEEAGILLAHNARDPECAKVRKLVAGGAQFGLALQELGLTPDFEALAIFARWVTPAQMRRRFDARFYLARLPEGQPVRPQAGEVTDWHWTSPDRATASPDITLVDATTADEESEAGKRHGDALYASAHR